MPATSNNERVGSSQSTDVSNQPPQKGKIIVGSDDGVSSSTLVMPSDAEIQQTIAMQDEQNTIFTTQNKLIAAVLLLASPILAQIITFVFPVALIGASIYYKKRKEMLGQESTYWIVVPTVFIILLSYIVVGWVGVFIFVAFLINNISLSSNK